ncbi:MAG: metallophosphoesterase [Acidobacteria bacterium]|nr:metallophosphoesterase [Acidobacteriota bacterium]
MPRSGKGRLGDALPLLTLLLALWLIPLSAAPFSFAAEARPAADEVPYAWTGVDRVVAVADLHGDYDRFVFILSHPAVALVDADLNWTGGRAHLVQLGDILDRGPQARRIFDLIRRLEGQAAAAGGMVHVLLGNHEEMNLTGIALDYPGYVTVEQFLSFLPADFRLAREEEFLKTLPPEERKRLQAAGAEAAFEDALYGFWQRTLARRNPEARQAYMDGLDRELGGWLLGLNTVIKIDDVVYSHAGISEAYSRWPLREINTVMRGELAFFKGLMRDPHRTAKPFKPKIVYEPDSPLWFRGLATMGDSAQAEVDRILANLGAKAMVVGHSFFYNRLKSGSSPVVERTAVARFQDKIWIMDTGISGSYGGIPSALIREGGTFTLWGETEEVAARSGVKTAAPKPMSAADTEAFLRTAAVTGRSAGPGGRTDAWRLTLEDRGRVHQALFKYVDRRRPDPLPDSYRYDLAAYALDRYLDLGLVPPIVERTVAETAGALQIFVADALSEEERRARRLAPEDPAYHARAMADLRVFQTLTYDDCRNDKDTLIGGTDGKVYRVDLSEAFAPRKSSPPRCPVRRCSRALYRRLLDWDDAEVARRLSPYLDKAEIEALNARRRLVLQVLATQIRVNGEANVLY